MRHITVRTIAAAILAVAAAGAANGAQTATGPVSMWSVSTTPGFSLIQVGGAADGSGTSLLCAVDATTNFGSTVMTSAASLSAQGANVSMTCTDTNQVSTLQSSGSSD